MDIMQKSTIIILMKVYSYIRLTSSDNDARTYQNQVNDFALANRLGRVQFVVEQTTLVKDWEKTQIGILVSEAKKDDLVIVPSLVMFSRSLIQVCDVLQHFHSKGVWVASVEQKLTITGETNDFNGGMMQCLTMVSDFERKLVSMRMKETLDRQRSLGMKVGRPVGSGRSALDAFSKEIIEAKKNGESNIVLSRIYHTTPQNMSKWLKKNMPKDKSSEFECKLYVVGEDDDEPADVRTESFATAGAMVRALVNFACEKANRSYTDYDVMLISDHQQGSYIFISDSELHKGFILSWAASDDLPVISQMHDLRINVLE